MTKYTETDIHHALEAIASGVSTKKASRDWAVPRATLYNRICGRECRKDAFSALQRLTKTQEKQLTEWILLQDALGLPPTHSQIRQFAQRMLAVKGDHIPLGKHWMQAFLRRNPAIRTQRCHHRDSTRVNGACTEVIRPWFNKFYIPEIQATKPENRYNMDEAGIMEGLGENGLVVGSSEKRSIQKKTPGARAWTSFIECVSATGVSLPPLVIFKGKSVQQQWFPYELDEFKGWQFTATKNGWTSDQTAVEWLEKIFIPMTQPADPTERRLLVLDGHGSHETADFMYLCCQHNIYLLYLPPHTSHVLQPLDLSVFLSLKRSYRKQVGFLSLLTDSSPVGKQNFLLCYQKARLQALVQPNIKSGWKASGLWPVSMAKPLMSRLLLENSNESKKKANNSTAAPETPTTSRSWLLETSQVAWSTPRRSKDLKLQVLKFSQLEDDVSTKRLLFRKITKSFDEKESLLAEAQMRIEALETQLEAARPRRRKKVKVSPNSRFVGIAAIQRTQEEVRTAEDIIDEASDASISDINDDCIVVQINDE